MTKCQSFCVGIFFDFNRNIKITKNMIRPLADRVVIEPKAAETQTASGLFIPDTAKEKPQQGTVVAAGPGKKDEPMEVKVGDVVIYGKYAGTDVSVDGKDYLITVCLSNNRDHTLAALRLKAVIDSVLDKGLQSQLRKLIELGLGINVDLVLHDVSVADLLDLKITSDVVGLFSDRNDLLTVA